MRPDERQHAADVFFGLLVALEHECGFAAIEFEFGDDVLARRRATARVVEQPVQVRGRFAHAVGIHLVDRQHFADAQRTCVAVAENLAAQVPGFVEVMRGLVVASEFLQGLAQRHALSDTGLWLR